MYNKKLIIPLLLIALGIFSAPFWLNTGKPKPAYPEIALPQGQGACVEDKEWMRAEHMQLLNVWRDKAVRENLRTYVSSDGRRFKISLQETCMGCHTNKEQFCDTCHTANGVNEPYCWTCHITSAEGVK